MIKKREDAEIKHLSNPCIWIISSVQIRWMMFMRILTITIQSEKEKKIIGFDDMIADIVTNKTFQAIIE